MNELKGLPVVTAMTGKITEQINILKSKNITPKLSVIRIGEREDDISYERGIIKRFSAVSAEVDITVLPSDVTQELLEETVIAKNNDETVHGILLFRPLPKHLSEARIKSLIKPEKDVDGMGMQNNAYIYEGNKEGYSPCTAQAVMELLDFYEIDLTGKKVTIVGRSLVVGKPLAMLMLSKNATVTVCHTKTVDLPSECKKADILIACAGVAKMITAEHIHENQIIIDVGINMLDGKLCGDVDYDGICDKVMAATPVPGGVGTVTTSVLLKNTVESAIIELRAQS